MQSYKQHTFCPQALWPTLLLNLFLFYSPWQATLTTMSCTPMRCHAEHIYFYFFNFFIGVAKMFVQNLDENVLSNNATTTSAFNYQFLFQSECMNPEKNLVSQCTPALLPVMVMN